MQIGEFTLSNEEKLDRAINGTVTDRGSLSGGVGRDASEEDIIAEYDRLGGLIRKGKYKVKMGCFYDFPNKKPFAKPKPVLQFSVNDEIVEVPADEPLPLEVRAAEQLKEKKAAKKAGKGKKVVDEDTDEEEGELA